MSRAFAEISFTPSVLAIQEQQGSAQGYAKFLEPEADRGDLLGQVEAEFISNRDGFYQATVSDTGWPYVQFRGGPIGFLKVLDDKTIAYADFRGNRQYLSAGNLGPVEIHRELMIAAAKSIIDGKLVSVLQARKAIRLNSFSFPK